MPMGEPVQAVQVALRSAGQPQELPSVVGSKVLQWDGRQELSKGACPRGAQRITSRKEESSVVGKRGQQRLAQPVVEQAQALERVDDQHSARVPRREETPGILGRRRGGAKQAAQRAEEARRGRLDTSALELHDRRPP